MTIKLIYSTWPNKEKASLAAKVLVQEELISCANIISSTNSIYLWQGKLIEEEEVLMFAKTKTDILEKAIKRIKELHTYEIPCVVTLDISGGDPDFINWVKTNKNYK